VPLHNVSALSAVRGEKESLEEYKASIEARIEERFAQLQLQAQLSARQQDVMFEKILAAIGTGGVGAGAGAAVSMSLGSTESKLTSRQEERLSAITAATATTNAKLLGMTSEQAKTIDSAVGTQVSSAARSAEAAGVLARLVETIAAASKKKLADLAHAKTLPDLLERLADEAADRGHDRAYRTFIRGHIRIIADLNDRGGYGIAKTYHYQVYDEIERAEQRGEAASYYLLTATGHAHFLSLANGKIQQQSRGSGGGGGKNHRRGGGKGRNSGGGQGATTTGETPKHGGKGGSLRGGGKGGGAGGRAAGGGPESAASV
jgi:hypothetical protein